jgi:rare lipoprotein A
MSPRQFADIFQKIIRLARRSMVMKSYSLAAVSLALLMGSATAAGKKPDECGLASFYSRTTEMTASGEDTRAENFTAAHRTLPFGTLVRVDNLENGRSAVVRITDRGPFIKGRIIDVSRIAARKLGISGLAKVCLKIQSVP